jgi:hypothetical protein
MIYKYNEFLLNNQFNSILNETIKQIGDRTYEWDLENDRVAIKLKNFLKNLTKDKIRSYYHDFINKVKSLPNSGKIIKRYSVVFLTLVSIGYLNQNQDIEVSDKTEITDTKANFKSAQNFVKLAEGGYTDNIKDRGNFVMTPQGKRLVGTNHGISAPVLAEWIKRLPTKEDMKNLSYETALEIYKKRYWDSQNLDELKDQSVATIIYDGCVNQGINAMKIIITKAIGEQNLKVDNPYDNIELINNLDQEKLFNSIKKFRKMKYKSTAGKDVYLRGWLNRLNSLKY